MAAPGSTLSATRMARVLARAQMTRVISRPLTESCGSSSTYFGKNGAQPSLKVSQNLASIRYGVFTVERFEELKPDLSELNLMGLKYKRKNAMMPHTALLEFIQEISRGIPNGVR